MSRTDLQRGFIWMGAGLIFLAPFWSFFRTASHEWFTNPMFSYGVLMPVISGYIIWGRRQELQAAKVIPSRWGILVLLAGCSLAVMGAVSGLLLVSGVGLCVSLIGATNFLWGKRHTRIVFLPLLLLVFMAPWPTFVMGSLSWRLQEVASAASASLLGDLGTVVYQDGNLLVLPDHVLEVKEACSGTRSLFALMALASVLAILMKQRWIWRLLLIAAAPGIALLANIIRIVGTGIAVQRFGGAATGEDLHAIWGLIVFVMAFGGLLSIQRLLKWASYKFESA